jgi:hypothetical protein
MGNANQDSEIKRSAATAHTDNEGPNEKAQKN